MLTRIILESVQNINRKILNALRREFNSYLQEVAASVNVFIRPIIQLNIQKSDAYKSLVAPGTPHSLNAELGLENAESKMLAVINAIISSLDFRVIPARIVGNELLGSLQFGLMLEGHTDLIALPEAEYVSEPSSSTIAWLNWLLLQGDSIIIRNYDVVYSASFANESRTGTALMKRYEGARWRVPPEFSGTSNSNFLTRAILDAVPELENMMEKVMRDKANV